VNFVNDQRCGVPIEELASALLGFFGQKRKIQRNIVVVRKEVAQEGSLTDLATASNDECRPLPGQSSERFLYFSLNPDPRTLCNSIDDISIIEMSMLRESPLRFFVSWCLGGERREPVLTTKTQRLQASGQEDKEFSISSTDEHKYRAARICVFRHRRPSGQSDHLPSPRRHV
jgi:hypothetical protein